MLPRIMVHGGAWGWEDILDAEKCAGVRKAASAGYSILDKGGAALDAVERAVIALEDNPALDAGSGAYINQDGMVQLDALIVDGAKQDFGAVAGVTLVKNPITLARLIMQRTPHCFFVGAGADQMAQALNLPTIPNEQLITPVMREHYLQRRTHGSSSDTVGAVAIDCNGNTAAATSTGGTAFKPRGRVGDSPLYGSGGYAQNGIGAAGATGLGENIMRVLLCKYICDKIAEGLTAGDAANAGMQFIEQRFSNSMAGVIVIDHLGRISAAHTTPKLAFAWVDDNGKVRSAIQSNTMYHGNGQYPV